MSPQNEDLVAWAYWRREGDKSQGIVVLNAETRRIHYNFNDRRYEYFSWFPNGDMLLVEGRRVYRARANGSGYELPELLFEHIVDLRGVEVAPNGQRLVFHSLGNIFTVNLDGSGLVKVMASTTHRYYRPSWSPDGQFLLFNSDGQATGNGYKSKHVVSADAMNIPLYHEHIQPGVMEIGESAPTNHDYDGPYVWR